MAGNTHGLSDGSCRSRQTIFMVGSPNKLLFSYLFTTFGPSIGPFPYSRYHVMAQLGQNRLNCDGWALSEYFICPLQVNMYYVTVAHAFFEFRRATSMRDRVMWVMRKSFYSSDFEAFSLPEDVPDPAEIDRKRKRTRNACT
jgi:hypothetical protein